MNFKCKKPANLKFYLAETYLTQQQRDFTEYLFNIDSIK